MRRFSLSFLLSHLALARSPRLFLCLRVFKTARGAHLSAECRSRVCPSYSRGACSRRFLFSSARVTPFVASFFLPLPLLLLLSLLSSLFAFISLAPGFPSLTYSLLFVSPNVLLKHLLCGSPLSMNLAYRIVAISLSLSLRNISR